MENGKIADFGTHDQLLKSNEIYQELYYSQNSAKVNGGEQNG